MLNISHCIVVSLMIVGHALRIKIVRKNLSASWIIYTALKFTCEFKLNASLSFLDVLVERVVDVTTVYRKPTFTGMCLQWDSFCSVKYKIALIRCLVNRALRICSVEKLSTELDFLRDTFLRNGYPAGNCKQAHYH